MMGVMRNHGRVDRREEDRLASCEAKVADVGVAEAASVRDAAGDACGGALLPGSSAPPAPAMDFGELYLRAVSVLDEEGLVRLEKRKRAAERLQRLMKESGRREVFDLEGVKRALCEYGMGALEGGRTRRIRDCFAKCGVRLSDLFGAMDRHHELRTVYEYICRTRSAEARAEAEELGVAAQEGQRRLVTEDGCRLNQRAVELSLKATMGDVYGDDGKDGGAKGDKKKVTYNLPNLTVNMIMSPAEIAAKRLDGNARVGEVVNV